MSTTVPPRSSETVPSISQLPELLTDLSLPFQVHLLRLPVASGLLPSGGPGSDVRGPAVCRALAWAQLGAGRPLPALGDLQVKGEGAGKALVAKVLD